MSRLMVETSENQKKMKSGFHKAETPFTCKLSILGNFVSPYLLQPRPSSLRRAGRGSGRVRGSGGGATETGAETGRRRRAGRTRGAAPRTPASRARASRPGLGRAMHRQRVRGDKVLNMALIGQKNGNMFSLNVYHDFDQFVEMTCNVSKCFLLQVMDTGSHSTWWRTSTWRPRSTSG